MKVGGSDGSIIDADSLRKSLLQIVESDSRSSSANQTTAGLGLVTAVDRDEWANFHKSLTQSKKSWI